MNRLDELKQWRDNLIMADRTSEACRILDLYQNDIDLLTWAIEQIERNNAITAYHPFDLSDGASDVATSDIDDAIEAFKAIVLLKKQAVGILEAGKNIENMIDMNGHYYTEATRLAEIEYNKADARIYGLAITALQKMKGESE
jgi:hypothetical protein